MPRQIVLHWAGTAAIAVLLVPVSDVSLAQNTLTFEASERRALTIPDSFFTSYAHASSGEIYMVPSQRFMFYKVQPATGNVETVPVTGIPDWQMADVRLHQALAADDHGLLYMPATWRTGRTGYAGVFVVNNRGTYQKTIVLKPPMRISRIALDGAGNVLVMGVDPEYIHHRTDQCMLVHRYSAEGERVASFSPCPANWNLLTPKPGHPGPDLSRLSHEADRGQLWTQNGDVYHLLPTLRRLRVFAGGGRLAREIVFAPPDAGNLLRERGFSPAANGAAEAWRVFTAGNGNFLVQWLCVENRTANSSRRLPLLALHDQEGRPVSRAAISPWQRSAPILYAGDGQQFFLRQETAVKYELIRARALAR